MGATKLMWVDCNGGSENSNYETQAAKRQHVMLNYLANPPGEVMEIRTQDPTDLIRTIEKKKRRATQKRHFTTQARTADPFHVVLSPAKALTTPTDRTVSNAAWWHFYNPYMIKNYQPTDWVNKCRQDWNTSLWEYARKDDVLREIFMSYSAAKQGHVSGVDTRNAYLSHKGNAIRLLSDQLNTTGNGLHISAVVTICLLCKAAFAEKEYEVAQSHVRAIDLLVGHRLTSIPGFLWLLIVWADLRMTAVNSDGPRLPYNVNPDFDLPLSSDLAELANERAQLNACGLPPNHNEPPDTLTRVFERLHQLALVYEHRETDWRVAWNVCYENAYWLATTQRNGMTKLSGPPGAGPGQLDIGLIYLSARIQFWGSSAPFVPQQGIQQHLQQEMMEVLRTSSVQALCDRWEAYGSLDALLWILFNTAISLLGYPLHSLSATSAALSWIRRCLTMVVARLYLEHEQSWEDVLKTFPFTNTWSQRYWSHFCQWFKTGEIPESANIAGILAPFGNLRLTFDPVNSGSIIRISPYL